LWGNGPFSGFCQKQSFEEGPKRRFSKSVWRIRGEGAAPVWSGLAGVASPSVDERVVMYLGEGPKSLGTRGRSRRWVRKRRQGSRPLRRRRNSGQPTAGGAIAAFAIVIGSKRDTIVSSKRDTPDQSKRSLVGLDKAHSHDGLQQAEFVIGSASNPLSLHLMVHWAESICI
jgi:hypothetical protein